jgi:hypothetical protein
MNRANRKAKLSKYEVVVTRQIEQVITLMVEARSKEEAQDVATNIANDDGRSWMSTVVNQNAKVRKLR